MSKVNANIYKTIGNNIRKYRLSKGLTQEKLAETLGLNDKYIGHIERNEKYISLKNLIAIADYFELNVKALLD